MAATLEFRSQRIAGWYVRAALPLFVLQVVVGLWLVSNYVFSLPQGLVDVFPFATAREIHTNLLVLWMLLGFMGGTYFVVPEETRSEIFSERVALVQLALLLGAGVAAIAGFLFGWTKGRPLLEMPRPLSAVVVVAALLFLANVALTMIRARRWTAIQGTLLAGLVFLALLYLFALPVFRNEIVDWYYWWWVIHLWVEGAWELVAGALMAFVLLRLSGVERARIEKWLYVEIGLVLFTGIVGTGHHYYWIGAPRYWLWWGGVFSALEPAPILLMVVDALRASRERRPRDTHPLLWTYAVGCAVFHFVGAGVFGFLHTLPQINRYTHGSQVTASHGHLAFFGAYALLNLTVFYFALARLRGIERLDERRGRVAFWTMCLSMLVMGLGFAVAGVLQSYIERVLALGFMTAQVYMRLWFGVVGAAGLCFLAGVLLAVRDLFGLRPASQTPSP